MIGKKVVGSNPYTQVHLSRGGRKGIAGDFCRVRVHASQLMYGTSICGWCRILLPRNSHKQIYGGCEEFSTWVSGDPGKLIGEIFKAFHSTNNSPVTATAIPTTYSYTV